MGPLHNIPRLSELSSVLLRLPITDRGTFATLTFVSHIQEWTTTKADEYRQFALALLAIHNLAAPIHRLPTEVLERILEQCWEDWKSLRLPHVCRLWRSILLGRPAFWADAVATDCELLEKRDIARNELPLIDTLLSRSTRHSHTIEPTVYGLSPSLVESLTHHSHPHHRLYSYYFAHDSTKLRSIVTGGAIDRVCLRQLPLREGRVRRHSKLEERPLEFFGEDAPVTRLVLSVLSPNSGGLVFDFRAFPHLVHLDLSGSDMETTVRMLQPNSREQPEGQAVASVLCPSLAGFVIDISCGFVDRSSSAAASGGRATPSLLSGPEDPGAVIDKPFQQKCADLQRILADRASSGNRLTSLTLRLCPLPISEPPDGGGSQDSADNGAAKPETRVIWPNRAARQSVLQSLRELVDGPVVFRFRRPSGWRDTYR
ncbi:hypothetical protein LXA43DRAFT_1187024 [Ganoderma leucocontextum]|nr:hypothetical protein LXA43DRAFT_1187024 [Ganoderma leucocontextum]